MPKKKPNPPEESGDLFGGQPRKKQVRKGRPPALPKGFDAYMDDFIQHTDAWITRFNEVWFMGPERPFERPSVTAKNKDDVLQRYAEAIETLQVMAKCAKDGQTWLKKGQTFAKEMLSEKKVPNRSRAEQCKVLDKLKNL